MSSVGGLEGRWLAVQVPQPEAGGADGVPADQSLRQCWCAHCWPCVTAQACRLGVSKPPCSPGVLAKDWGHSCGGQAWCCQKCCQFAAPAACAGIGSIHLSICAQRCRACDLQDCSSCTHSSGMGRYQNVAPLLLAVQHLEACREHAVPCRPRLMAPRYHSQAMHYMRCSLSGFVTHAT